VTPRRWDAAAPGFPPRLRTIEDAPPELWVRAALDDRALAEGVWALPAVAIVGARAASASGLALARDLAWDLARRGIVVVSGLARGIDGAAHEGALLADGVTIAVMGCGIEDCYPAEHASLAERITLRGALVSEWPGRTPVRPWRFPRRNRLVSGLADLLILVEGGPQSGALHTVAYATRQGREVMAVPRDPNLPGSLAPNRLIRDGAAPVLDAEDAIACLEAVGARQGRAPAADADPGPLVLRGRIERRLARGEPVSPEQLAQGLPEAEAAALLAELLTLEIEGRVARDRAGRLRLQIVR
jgi:DNA processing protein